MSGYCAFGKLETAQRGGGFSDLRRDDAGGGDQLLGRKQLGDLDHRRDAENALMVPGVSVMAKPVENRIRAAEALARSGLLAAASGGICLDFGDSGCYGGSGQTLTDLLGTVNFNRGTTSGSEGSDPAFNGTAGNLSKSERLTFDGGDCCTISGSNPAGVNNLHKNNARFTALAALKLVNTATARGVFGTCSTSESNTGFRWFITTGLASGWRAHNGSASTGVGQGPGVSFAPDVWVFAGFAFDEAAGAGGVHFFTDGVYSTADATVSSPSSSNATHALQIGAAGNSGSPMLNGDEIGFFSLLFDHAATEEEFRRFFTLMTPRYKI